MPIGGPGKRYSVLATKATTHGKPAVEKNHPGIAHKSSQPAPAVPNTANALAATQIAIGEEFVIDVTGLHEVAVADLPGGAAEGDALYIRKADNVLRTQALGSADGFAVSCKFGVISSIDVTLARALVNLNLRDVF